VASPAPPLGCSRLRVCILQVHPYSGYYRFCLVAGQRNAASWYDVPTALDLLGGDSAWRRSEKKPTAPIAEPRRTSRLKAITPPVVDRTSLSGSLYVYLPEGRTARTPFVAAKAATFCQNGSVAQLGIGRQPLTVWSTDRSTVSERQLFCTETCRWCDRQC
jgi:hypothetical protein